MRLVLGGGLASLHAAIHCALLVDRLRYGVSTSDKAIGLQDHILLDTVKLPLVNRKIVTPRRNMRRFGFSEQ